MFCHFPMWCPGSGVVLDCIDSFVFLLRLNILMAVSYDLAERSKGQS